MTKFLDTAHQDATQKKTGQRVLPRDINETHQRNGYYDGKIFFAEDKATYTFLHDERVIILHLDAVKHCLYINGHKVDEIQTDPELIHYLAQFRIALSENEKTHHLIIGFDQIVAGVVKPA